MLANERDRLLLIRAALKGCITELEELFSVADSYEPNSEILKAIVWIDRKL